MAVVKLACGATTVHNVYAFAVAIFLGVGDVAFIVYSYGKIVSTVIHFPSPEARSKAGSTCMAHVCVILFFYPILLISSHIFSCWPASQD